MCSRSVLILLRRLRPEGITQTNWCYLLVWNTIIKQRISFILYSLFLKKKEAVAAAKEHILARQLKLAHRDVVNLVSQSHFLALLTLLFK